MFLNSFQNLEMGASGLIEFREGFHDLRVSVSVPIGISINEVKKNYMYEYGYTAPSGECNQGHIRFRECLGGYLLWVSLISSSNDMSSEVGRGITPSNRCYYWIAYMKSPVQTHSSQALQKSLKLNSISSKIITRLLGPVKKGYLEKTE